MLKDIRAIVTAAREQGTRSRNWFEIHARPHAQSQAESADVLIYDYIGWGGVTAADFAKALQSVTAKTINVRLNTPGGDVFDGLAIYNSLKGHGAEINVRVEGLAASIGSIIAMAGKTITMAESSFFMVHAPWALVIGNAADMRMMADTLDKVAGSLMDIYASRTKASRDTITQWMQADTWFTAEESKAAGLADAVDTGDAQAQAAAQFDLSGYANVPTALTAAPAANATEPDAQRVNRAAVMRRRLALVERGERSV